MGGTARASLVGHEQPRYDAPGNVSSTRVDAAVYVWTQGAAGASCIVFVRPDRAKGRGGASGGVGRGDFGSAPDLRLRHGPHRHGRAVARTESRGRGGRGKRAADTIGVLLDGQGCGWPPAFADCQDDSPRAALRWWLRAYRYGAG